MGPDFTLQLVSLIVNGVSGVALAYLNSKAQAQSVRIIELQDQVKELKDQLHTT